jgi:hypothetical protein
MGHVGYLLPGGVLTARNRSGATVLGYLLGSEHARRMITKPFRSYSMIYSRHKNSFHYHGLDVARVPRSRD